MTRFPPVLEVRAYSTKVFSPDMTVFVFSQLRFVFLFWTKHQVLVVIVKDYDPVSWTTREYSLRRKPFFVHPLECPVLPSSLANGFILGSGSLEGAQYNFSCKKGYSLIGADTVVCTDAGVWNGSLPTCLIGIWAIDIQLQISLP